MTCGNHQILTHFKLDILHQLPLTKLVIIPAQLKQSSLSAAPGVLFQNRSFNVFSIGEYDIHITYSYVLI